MYLQHNGTPVFVRGYTAVFNRFSVPLDCNDGQREIIRPGAFDRLVVVRPLDLVCSAYHLQGPGFASMRARNLKIWTDDFGLAFEAGPLRPTPVNRSIISAIVNNQMRACSWLATISDSRIEQIGGEEVQAIYKFASVDHIGPVEEGAYPDTCCWCSHEDPANFSAYAQQIVACWNASRPKEKPKSTAPIQPAARIAAIRQIQKQPVTDEELYGPSPAGMTMAEWLDFGHRIACAASQHQRAGRQRTSR